MKNKLMSLFYALIFLVTWYFDIKFTYFEVMVIFGISLLLNKENK